MRALFLVLAVLSIAACESLIFKLPTRQGNVIEQKQLDRLELGMTRDQVRFLLGTPIAASPLRNDRWDYVGYYKDPRGRVSRRAVALHFDGDRLVRMEGVSAGEADQGVETPDVERLLEEEDKQQLEEQRGQDPQTGVILGPESREPQEEEPRETGEPRIE